MVTQEEIAKRLGVSRQLVTFALAGYPQVARKSRERILAAAREMGYRPNPHARALVTRQTGIVALWIPDQISSHYAHVAREFGRMIREAGRELIISEVGSTDATQIFSHVPVDAICAVDGSAAVLSQLEALARKPLPVVSVGAFCSDKTDAIQVDLLSGTLDLMRHLVDSGFRRIAHATFVRQNTNHDGRKTGYARAMRQAGLKPEYIFYPLTERQRPVARQLIRDYIAGHGAPEVIFCHSDDAALGIYRGLCDLGLRVPEQVALAGCDGIEDVEYLECPLTTLVQPVEGMCRMAWEFLRQRLEEPARPTERAVLKPELALRQSSRR